MLSVALAGALVTGVDALSVTVTEIGYAVFKETVW
jgi:hypothetical protein